MQPGDPPETPFDVGYQNDTNPLVLPSVPETACLGRVGFDFLGQEV